MLLDNIRPNNELELLCLCSNGFTKKLTPNYALE